MSAISVAFLHHAAFSLFSVYKSERKGGRLAMTWKQAPYYYKEDSRNFEPPKITKQANLHFMQRNKIFT